MKISRQRYQVGSVRKVPRSHGFAWEFRYYSTDVDGIRRAKVQTFDSETYPSERDVRLAVQGQLAALNADTLGGRVNVTFGMLIDRYLKEELPNLLHSTQTTNKSLLEVHIRPKWGDYRLPDIKAMEVKRWLDSLPFGAASKVRARNTISRLLDLAMLWEYLPVERNPMELIKVKGSTKRQKAIVIITKDAGGKGIVAIDSGISSQDLAKSAVPLKIAVDTGEAKKVAAYQKYKALNNLNLPR